MNETIDTPFLLLIIGLSIAVLLFGIIVIRMMRNTSNIIKELSEFVERENE